MAERSFSDHMSDADALMWNIEKDPVLRSTIVAVGLLAAQQMVEMRRDDPSVFQALLDVALRQGQSICADTDMAAEVWNGVVTRIHLQKLAQDDSTRVTRWRVRLDARFGTSSLDYLVAHDEKGAPVRYCTSADGTPNPPDFLWQELPDISSKAFEEGEWHINEEMLARGIVEATHDPSADGERYVFDDHVKNVYEILFCGFGGFPWTVVHGNKRYGFRDEATWKQAVEQLQAARGKLRFTDGTRVRRRRAPATRPAGP